MRAYTLSVLSSLANSNNPIVEKEIVAWVNQKLQNAGKTSSLRSFQDSTIANGKVVIDLVDSIKPGCINYDLVKHGDSEEVRFHFLNILLRLRLKNCFNSIGSHCQRQICHLNGTQDWRPSLCTT